MLSVEECDPKPAFILRIKKKDRRKKEYLKARQQSWYKGIFSEAENVDGDSDEDENPSENMKRKSFL